MLQAGKVVGFIQVADKDRACQFYKGMLGLQLHDDGFAMVVRFSGGLLRITSVPNYTPPEHPAFGFEVADANAVVGELAEKGIVFERYEFLGDAQDADGVWEGPDGSRVAWFKDPDGNILTISSHAAQD